MQADGAAYAERTTAEAQAAANSVRADSLRDGAQELIAANRVVENLPALVEAAAQGIAGSNLTILNGSEGVSQVAAGIVGQGLAILDVLKRATPKGSPEPQAAQPSQASQASQASQVVEVREEGRPGAVERPSQG